MQLRQHLTTRMRPSARGPICLLLLLASGCSDHAEDPDRAKSSELAAQRGPLSQVLVADAKMIVWPRIVHVQGNLLSDERVIVGTKVAGRIASLGEDAQHHLVDLGSEVGEGDILARLETEELELKVQQAESQMEQVRATLGLQKAQDDAQLDPSQVPSVVQEKSLWDAAQDNWDRAKALERETAISGEELQLRKSLVDVAAARYESALHEVDKSIALLGQRRAELGLARQVLRDAEIRAPFAGVIEQRYVAPGAYVQMGQPVVALVKVNPWRFRACVPEREAAAVRLGQRVSIRIEGEQCELDAVIARVSPSVEMSSRSLTVEAVRQEPAEASSQPPSDVPEPLLRRGLFAEADIYVEPEAQTLAVPKAAVQEFAGVEKVWRVVEGEAAEQTIETGRRNDAFVEILGGLTAGDVVIVEGIPKQAGQVEVVKEQ